MKGRLIALCCVSCVLHVSPFAINLGTPSATPRLPCGSNGGLSCTWLHGARPLFPRTHQKLSPRTFCQLVPMAKSASGEESASRPPGATKKHLLPGPLQIAGNVQNPALRFALVCLLFFVPLWMVLVPAGVVLQTLCRPFMSMARRPSQDPAMHCKVLGPVDSLETLLFVHGFPDSGKLWSQQVASFSKDYRCIIVTLPCFGGEDIADCHGYDFDEISDMLADVVAIHAKSKPVTIICHDWGCIYSFKLQSEKPELVSRIVALDIGPRFDVTPPQLLYLLNYQSFIAFCFLLGEPAGTWILRLACRYVQYDQRDYNEISSALGYPYFFILKAIVADPSLPGLQLGCDLDECPVLFIYGTEAKPYMFHTQSWIESLQRHASAGGRSRVVALSDDHWLSIQSDPSALDPAATQGVHAEIRAWLREGV